MADLSTAEPVGGGDENLQLQDWFHRVETIISLPGGKLELSEGQRRIVLVFADGSFLVDADNLGNPQIIALREVARRKGITVGQTYPVSIELIRQLYDEAAKSLGGKTHENQGMPMQRDWLVLLQEAVNIAASDVHIYVHVYEADIKFRINGDMHPIRQVSALYGHELLAAAYNMAEAADATYRVFDYQAARISSLSVPLPKGLQSVRLQLNPMGNGGRYLIARLLYADNRWEQRLSLDSMGLHPSQLRLLGRMRQAPEGVNIISGPTGSGKSTTLKVLLEQLYHERREKINILTIEDPPEYEIYGAAQLPVTNVENEVERGVAYRKAIVAALRSDPDVIMPGEARDKEVINLVFTAAMTGHQVWTSLHANSALAIFDRLRDQGVESFKLTDPSLLTGLTAQRLVKRLCSDCSLPLTDEMVQRLELILPGFDMASDGFLSSIRVVNPEGCDNCRNGYLGRMALSEVICPDQEFLDLMQRGEREQAAQHWMETLDGITMMEHGWLHMINGNLDPRDLVDRLGPFHGLSPIRRATLQSLR
ncbi:GspE/PulE family protein [Aeromonas sp. MdU4]|uniref:GspE/PulE family protein n=1 Tax=Aeromonas sp. MdU4 TaxID=3342819 RepID=UPI0035B997F2